MLRMNGVDDSDYESSDAGSYDYDGEEDEDGVGDEPERVVEEDDGSIEGSDYDEDAFDANDSDADPAEFEDDEAFARALQDAEEREVAVRLMALTGLNECERMLVRAYYLLDYGRLDLELTSSLFLFRGVG